MGSTNCTRVMPSQKWFWVLLQRVHEPLALIVSKQRVQGVLTEKLLGLKSSIFPYNVEGLSLLHCLKDTEISKPRVQWINPVQFTMNHVWATLEGGPSVRMFVHDAALNSGARLCSRSGHCWIQERFGVSLYLRWNCVIPPSESEAIWESWSWFLNCTRRLLLRERRIALCPLMRIGVHELHVSASAQRRTECKSAEHKLYSTLVVYFSEFELWEVKIYR